jgi:hypothetical protein
VALGHTTVKRLPGGGLRVRLDPQERDLLFTIPQQLRPAWTGEAGPEDVLARLFPPAHAEADLEAEYRMLTGDQLALRRSETLDRFLTSFHKGAEHRGAWTAELSPDEAHAWLQVVNDTRLTLATVEGIRTESDWEAQPQTPRRLLLHWLGWFEEQLVGALMGALED